MIESNNYYHHLKNLECIQGRPLKMKMADEDYYVTRNIREKGYKVQRQGIPLDLIQPRRWALVCPISDYPILL